MIFPRNTAHFLFLWSAILGLPAEARADFPDFSLGHSRFELAQLDPLPPEQRRQMRQQMREHWQQLPPEERHERREAFQQMPPEERSQMRDKVRDELRGQREHWDGGERGTAERPVERPAVRPLDGRGRR